MVHTTDRRLSFAFGVCGSVCVCASLVAVEQLPSLFFALFRPRRRRPIPYLPYCTSKRKAFRELKSRSTDCEEAMRRVRSLHFSCSRKYIRKLFVYINLSQRKEKREEKACSSFVQSPCHIISRLSCPCPWFLLRSHV